MCFSVDSAWALLQGSNSLLIFFSAVIEFLADALIVLTLLGDEACDGHVIEVMLEGVDVSGPGWLVVVAGGGGWVDVLEGGVPEEMWLFWLGFGFEAGEGLAVEAAGFGDGGLKPIQFTSHE